MNRKRQQNLNGMIYIPSVTSPHLRGAPPEMAGSLDSTSTVRGVLYRVLNEIPRRYFETRHRGDPHAKCICMHVQGYRRLDGDGSIGYLWALVPVTRHGFHSLDLLRRGKRRRGRGKKRHVTDQGSPFFTSPFIIHPSPVVSPTAKCLAHDPQRVM